MLNFFCAFIGLTWLACLPYVSITTLEAKPRSLYFDETTLAPLAARSTITEMREYECNGTCVIRPAPAGLALIGSSRSAPFVLAIASFFAQSEWSEGLVVAITDDVEQWVDDYHSVQPMPRSGPLRAALVVDSGAWIGRVKGRIQPNLDFVHLVATALDLRLEGGGPHTQFLKYGIDAMTVEVPFTRRAAVGIELIFRSLNNLEHDLHHSYFMYWLFDDYFVSVNEYAWPLMLLVAAFALTAFNEFVEMDLSLLSFTSFVAPLVFGSVCYFNDKFLPFGYLVVVCLVGTVLRPLVLLYWAYAHAALVLLDPQLCAYGTLISLPFLIPSKLLQRLWWVLTFMGLIYSPPHQTYLCFVVVPCHTLLLALLLR